MRVLSMDLRERIVAACDAGDGPQAQVAARFAVSLGMVKKWLAQRRRTGDIGPRYHRCGRRKTHQRQLRALVRKKPDLTLAQLRAATGLRCSLVAIHHALAKQGLTYKKRRCAPASRTAPTSRGRAVSGDGDNAPAASTRPGSSSWMKPAPRQT
jgi:transposase